MADILLKLKNLKKKFRIGTEDFWALSGVNFAVKKGEFVAIMGPSGSGKTTMMNIIGGMDQATSGEYIFNNKAIHDLSKTQMAAFRNQQIGFIFQSFNLLKRYNVFQNVILPLEYSKSQPHDLRKHVLELLEKLEIASKVEQQISQLSGGQIQRVAIARALINNPSLLLADEPTGNLDSSTSEKILKIFKALHQQGNTIILVTHDAHVASYAERIIQMQDGKIILVSE
ncbi:MAG: ABC transporter ATP-binding protein [bacterium]